MEEDTKGRRLRAERNLTRGQGDTTGQDTEWSEAKLDRAAPPRGKDDATLARGHADTLAQHTAAAAAADTRGGTRAKTHAMRHESLVDTPLRGGRWRNTHFDTLSHGSGSSSDSNRAAIVRPSTC